MSTLIQWGSVQVVDLQRKDLLLNRLFSTAVTPTRRFAGGEIHRETLHDLTPKS